MARHPVRDSALLGNSSFSPIPKFASDITVLHERSATAAESNWSIVSTVDQILSRSTGRPKSVERSTLEIPEERRRRDGETLFHHAAGCHCMPIQVAVNRTGVHRDRSDLRIPTSKLRREENVGGLGSTIAAPRTAGQQRVCRSHAFKCSRADNVSGGRQSDDPNVWRGTASANIGERLLQRGQEQLGEKKMADMVGTELDLEAFLRFGRWITHSPGIEDQKIQPVTVRLESICRGANGLERSEIQRDKANIDRGRKLRLD